MIDYSKYEFSKTEIAFIIFIYSIISSIVALMFYHNPKFSIVMIVFMPLVFRKFREYKINERRKLLIIEFKDLLFNLASCMGARNSLRYSIKESIDVIASIYGNNSVLKEELKYMYKRMEYEDDVIVLRDFANRTRIEDVYDFVQIYETCKYTGANMVIAINKASNVIIEKMTIENEIKEIINRKKKEGFIILIMPMAVLLFLNICATDYIQILYNNARGNIIMTIVLIGYLLVYKLIENITKMEV